MSTAQLRSGMDFAGESWFLSWGRMPHLLCRTFFNSADIRPCRTAQNLELDRVRKVQASK
jgi:hypothetical protein